MMNNMSNSGQSNTLTIHSSSNDHVATTAATTSAATVVAASQPPASTALASSLPGSTGSQPTAAAGPSTSPTTAVPVSESSLLAGAMEAPADWSFLAGKDKCCICWRVFQTEVIGMHGLYVSNCKHVFCMTCAIDSARNGRFVTCPMCRSHATVVGELDAYGVIDLTHH
jgi:hypothetical protein